MTNSIYADHYYGFVYLWFDTKRNMFYVGSHWGKLDDGYVCSSNRMRFVYRDRPHTFRRRILYYLRVADRSVLLQEEKRWLDMIHDQELNKKYYNARKNAIGLSPEEMSTLSKEYWDRPGSRKKQSEILKQQLTEERCKTHSEFMKQKWQDPEYRGKIKRTGVTKDMMTEDGIRRRKEATAKRVCSPETRERMRLAAIARCSTPEYQAKFRARVHNKVVNEKRNASIRKLKKGA